MRRRSLVIPLFLIVMGSLWFIKSIDLMPETSSIIAIGLAVLGLVVLITDGINKQSIGRPFFDVFGRSGVFVLRRVVSHFPYFIGGHGGFGVFVVALTQRHGSRQICPPSVSPTRLI